MSDAKPVDPVKDFQYYADIAESVLSQAFETATPPLIEQQRIMVAAADVYARLAAAAPEPTPQRIELHDAACPCIKK